MICGESSAAYRRYYRRFILTTLAYVPFVLLAVWEFKHGHPAGVGAYVLAILPALPILGALVIAGMYLSEETDEFQRAILTQAMLYGIGLTLAVTTVWGFLENFELVPRMDLFLVFPLFSFLVGIASPVVKARYR